MRSWPKTQKVCQVQEICGLCPDVNQPYSKSLPQKYKKEIEVFEKNPIFSSTRFLPAVESPLAVGYRCAAKLAIEADKQNQFKIGLYAPGTHDVTDIEQCPLHTSSIRRLLPLLKERLDASSLTPWNGQSGDIRYLVIRASHLTDELMLTFITSRNCKKDLVRIVRGMKDTQIVSLYQSIHDGNGNGIFGSTPEHLAGISGLRESLCQLQFQLGPRTFFQINPRVASQLYRRIEHIAGNGKNLEAWDFYCGSGPITMLLARAGYQVTGVEENPESIEYAERNMSRNHLKARLLVSRVENTALSGNPSLIVVNPSRRGMAAAARQRLKDVACENKSTVIYISCNAETLIRDLEELTTESNLKVRQVEPFDMFPQTGHFEWLTVLSV